MALRWVFTADTGPFRKGLNQMRPEAKAWSSTLTRMFTGVFTAGAVVAGFRSWLRQMDELGKSAKRLGTSVEALQRAKLLGELNDIDVQQLTNLMIRLERRFGEAQRGSDQMAQSLANLGLEAEKFRALEVDQQLIALSAAFKRAEGSGTEVADLMKVLDTEARELLPLLKQGPEALAAELENASVVSAKQVEQIEALNDRLTRLKAEIAPAIGAVVVFVQRVAQTIGETVGSGINQFKNLFDYITTGFRNVGAAVKASMRGDFAEAYARLSEVGLDSIETAKDVADEWSAAGKEVRRIWGLAADEMERAGQAAGRAGIGGAGAGARIRRGIRPQEPAPQEPEFVGPPREAMTPPSLADILRENPVPFNDAAVRPLRPPTTIPVSDIRSIGGDAGAASPSSKLLEIGQLQLGTLRSIDAKLGKTADGLPRTAEPRG